MCNVDSLEVLGVQDREEDQLDVYSEFKDNVRQDNWQI